MSDEVDRGQVINGCRVFDGDPPGEHCEWCGAGRWGQATCPSCAGGGIIRLESIDYGVDYDACDCVCCPNACEDPGARMPLHKDSVRKLEEMEQPGYWPDECRPHSLPFWIFRKRHERCLLNHDQTPQRLAERGGLGLEEIWFIIEDRRWSSKEARELSDLFESFDWLTERTQELWEK